PGQARKETAETLLAEESPRAGARLRTARLGRRRRCRRLLHHREGRRGSLQGTARARVHHVHEKATYRLDESAQTGAARSLRRYRGRYPRLPTTPPRPPAPG